MKRIILHRALWDTSHSIGAAAHGSTLLMFTNDDGKQEAVDQNFTPLLDRSTPGLPHCRARALYSIAALSVAQLPSKESMGIDSEMLRIRSSTEYVQLRLIKPEINPMSFIDLFDHPIIADGRVRYPGIGMLPNADGIIGPVIEAGALFRIEAKLADPLPSGDRIRLKLYIEEWGD